MAELNAQQLEAVSLNHDKILCLAGAGTGKTFCMLARISRLVSEGVDPSSILVLTFTNNAAFEMKERYRRDHPKQRIPEFRTFHSFCYSLLVSNAAIRHELGYYNIPKIADKQTTRRIEKETKLKLGITLSEKKLSGKVPLNMREADQYMLYQKGLKKALRAAELITFDELCYKICNMFTDEHPLTAMYKRKYKYIFVDEFQDTDDRQNDFVNSFEDSKLFVVGDALQAIYAFRGADSAIIKSLAEDPSWKTVKLFENYRSTSEICNFANKNSTHARDHYRIEIHSSRSDKSSVEYEEVSSVPIQYGDTVLVEPYTLSDILKHLPTAEGTSAILCRTNKEVDYLSEVLSQRNIPHSTQKRDNDAVHILKSVADDEYLIDWLSTYLPAEKYAEFLRLTAIEDESDPKMLFVSNYGNIRHIKIRLQLIANIQAIIHHSPSIAIMCTDILEVLGVKDASVECTATTVPEIIQNLIDILEEDEAEDLYVGTVHSSKGLEYDNVFLIGVDVNSFKLTNEENRNLYYVGITRAKNFLKVYRCKDLSYF